MRDVANLTCLVVTHSMIVYWYEVTALYRQLLAAVSLFLSRDSRTSPTLVLIPTLTLVVPFGSHCISLNRILTPTAMLLPTQSMGCLLPGLEPYPSLESQEERFARAGWDSARAADMLAVFQVSDALGQRQGCGGQS